MIRVGSLLLTVLPLVVAPGARPDLSGLHGQQRREALESFPPPGPHAHAEALLEKTLFRIDVARLDLWFGEETAAALKILGAQGLGEEPGPEPVTFLALESSRAWARLRFLRDIGFRRFLDGIRESLEAARRARLVEDGFARTLSDSFDVWYDPLRERGVRDGDEMIYLIRQDTLRTVFRTVDGRILVDHVDVGTQPRRAVLGGFLAPGSDFRDGLLETLRVVGDPVAGGLAGAREPAVPRFPSGTGPWPPPPPRPGT